MLCMVPLIVISKQHTMLTIYDLDGDILFVKLTEFAIANKLKSIDFGSVINVTKQRMVNKTKNMSYFLFSKYLIVQKIFNIFLRMTKIQGKEQMKFQKNQT